MTPDINDHTIFMGLLGSRAYNIHCDTSDYDYKGIEYIPRTLFNPKDHYHLPPGLNYEGEVFSIEKFMKMAAKGVVAALEMLYLPNELIIHETLAYQTLANSRHFFLSKRVLYAIQGYALSQLKHLEKTKALFESLKGSHLEAWKQRLTDKRRADYEMCGYDTKKATHLLRLLQMANAIATQHMLVLDVNHNALDRKYFLAVRSCEVDYELVKHQWSTMLEHLQTNIETTKLRPCPNTDWIEDLYKQILDVADVVY